jgi:hypothetical protein
VLGSGAASGLDCYPAHAIGSAGREDARVDRAELPDYYEVLQVNRNAEPLVVNRVYRLLAACYHPDNKDTGDPGAFVRIAEAHGVLSDPVRRAAYDREKFGAPARPASNGRTPVPELGPERRTEDERELRRQLLRALYDVRRTRPHRPSPPLMVIPDLFGCSIDEAQFTLWYLRAKKLIEMTDDGMAITVAGVDCVEDGELGLERQGASRPSLVSRSVAPHERG